VMNLLDAFMMKSLVTIRMNVRLILANLNLVVSLTGTLFVMITMNVQLMNAYLLMVVRPQKLFVTIMTNVPKTLVILTKDAFLQLSVVMTIMLVPMILAALKLDANTLLDLLMTMTYVPLMYAKKMEKSLIPQLTAMITTHVLQIAVANPLEHVNTKLLNVTTTMLALLILAVLILVANTSLWFAKINLAILCLATLNMDVNMIMLSVMMKISVL